MDFPRLYPQKILSYALEIMILLGNLRTCLPVKILIIYTIIRGIFLHILSFINLYIIHQFTTL